MRTPTDATADQRCTADPGEPDSAHPRRRVLTAGLTGSAAIIALAGCGGDDSEPASADTSADAGSDTGGSAGSLAPQEVPVGGAAYLESGNTVVTQPSEGDFRAFDATCPHQGCAVNQAVDGELKCPCHDSRFDLSTGEVLGGPAQTGLTEREVSLDGDELVVGEGR